MATHPNPDDRDAEQPDVEYDVWKRAKVMRGLEQSRDRSTMIPAEQVWSELKLER